jgi:hypothetical protein
MILFADYLEKKWCKGYVIYWCTAGEPRFEVATLEEYNPDNFWVGPIHWRTNLAHEKLSDTTS